MSIPRPAELWGYPTRIKRTVAVRDKVELWVYGKQSSKRRFWEYKEGNQWRPEVSYIFIKNGKVISWQSDDLNYSKKNPARQVRRSVGLYETNLTVGP